MPEARKATRRGIQVYQTFAPTIKDRAQAQSKKEMKELIDELKAQNETTQALYEKLTAKVQEAETLYNSLVTIGRNLDSVNHTGQYRDKD